MSCIFALILGRPREVSTDALRPGSDVGRFAQARSLYEHQDTERRTVLRNTALAE